MVHSAEKNLLQILFFLFSHFGPYAWVALCYMLLLMVLSDENQVSTCKHSVPVLETPFGPSSPVALHLKGNLPIL